MARVVSIATDLMLASRVDAGLTAAGHHVVLAQSVEGAPLDEAELIVADLDVADPVALAAALRRILVDVQREEKRQWP